MGDSQHTEHIQNNKVIGENEKYIFNFTEKTKWNFCPTQYNTYTYAHTHMRADSTHMYVYKIFKILNRSGESGPPCLVPDLSGKDFSS